MFQIDCTMYSTLGNIFYKQKPSIIKEIDVKLLITQLKQNKNCCRVKVDPLGGAHTWLPVGCSWGCYLEAAQTE